MRNSAILRLASAAVLAVMAGSVMSSPATAFVGLSDKQADEISEFIKCKTYLLKGDLASFEADEDCGHGPVAVDLKSMVGSSGGAPSKRDEHCYEGTKFTAQTEGGEYCYPSY